MYADTPRRALVPVAMGEEPADLVVTGGTHVNVHTGELIEEDVAIKGDRIAAVGDVEYAIGDDTEVVDASDQYVTPGLVEGHLHTYHSMFNGTDVSKLLLQHGTTAVADGFYGPGNVAGLEGIEFAKSEIEATPVKLVFLIPTLSHAQMSIVGIPKTETALTDEQVYSFGEAIEQAFARSDIAPPGSDDTVGFLRQFRDYNRLREKLYREAAERRDLWGHLVRQEEPARRS